MGLQQLYYTSCEHGLSGYAGFQFNAVSPGVVPRLMRQVEELTNYQRPRDAAAGAEPVNLCHKLDPETGVTMTAQVVYAGVDSAGRQGNYFAHAIASAQPARDLDGLRPVELWGSRGWARDPIEDNELPALPEPPQTGPVDRIVVADHLAGVPDATALLARLLTATLAADAGGPPVVLRSATVEQNALWIAAVTYLLDDDAARRVSFATYTSRPDRCRVSLIGTIADPEIDALVAGLGGGFHLFDMAQGRRSDIEPHPTALLLAALGPVRAAGVWSQARQFATGTESSLDDWRPVIAAMQELDGRGPGLPPEDLDMVAGWLVSSGGRGSFSASRTDAVLRVVLQRAGEVSTERLRALAPVAETTDGDNLDAIEAVLLARTLADLEAGRRPDGATDPVSDRGRAAAGRHVIPRLGRPDPAAALDALEWARRARIPLPAEELNRCAVDVLGPALEHLDTARVVAVCPVDRANRQAFAGGLAENLAAGTTPRALTLLRGPLGPLLDGIDLGPHPRVQEYILFGQVATGRLTPTAALGEITELRGSDNPLQDREVLAALWPDGRWSIAEAHELLGRLDADSTEPLGLLERALDAPADDADLDAWLALAADVHRHLVFAALSGTVAQRVADVAGIGTTLTDAHKAAGRDPEAWFVGPEAAIATLSRTGQPQVRGRLARLILGTKRPGPALTRCHPDTFDACCREARKALSQVPLPHELGARLVVALDEMHEAGGERYVTLAYHVVAPQVAAWDGRDVRELRRRLRDRGAPRPKPPVAGDAPWWNRAVSSLDVRRPRSSGRAELEKILEAHRERRRDRARGDG